VASIQQQKQGNQLMKIEILTTFLDGRDRFEAGDIRTVSDADGARFVAAGWAKDMSGEIASGVAAEGATDLAIDNASHDQSAKIGA
jgi:hypothetical protein